MDANMTENGEVALSTLYKGFEPAAYLKYYYSQDEVELERKDNFVAWEMTCLHRSFTEGDISGEVLVDIGSGPTLYQVMSGCEVFNKVILTDYLKVNRQELRLWLQGEGGSKMDWTPFLQHACKLEGRRPSEWTEKAARLRQVVTDILPIDVHLPQPLPHDALPPAGADCLVSSCCLEAVSPDLAAFKRALGNIGELLKPGGHLLLIGDLGGSYYRAGPGVKIPMVTLSEAMVCDSLKENSFNLIRLDVYNVYDPTNMDDDDVSSVFVAKAVKGEKFKGGEKA